MHTDLLVFSGPLDAATAQNTGNYHVTQKISKKKTANVRVLSAMYSAGTHSVTLILASPKAGKPLQVAVSGLKGADGTPMGPFVTGL
jgi:hypothetical protein